MELFDTHCHLDVDAFDPDRSSVLREARNHGVRHLLIPAITRSGWDALWRLCAGDARLYPAIGLHPMFLDQHANEDIEALQAFTAANRPVAIGEIGLDYQVRSLDKTRQHALLEAQLEVAEALQLPVVLHCRKAHDEMLKILRGFRLPGGFCHAFNGSIQQAGKYQDLGFKLGFGGMLTYPNARRLHDLARNLPLEAIVLETDAPDMTGICHRYQRNSPAYLPEVCEVLAELQQKTPESIAAATLRNGLDCLGLS